MERGKRGGACIRYSSPVIRHPFRRRAFDPVHRPIGCVFENYIPLFEILADAVCCVVILAFARFFAPVYQRLDFRILDLGPRYAVIKKGEHGAALFGSGVAFSCPAYPVSEVVDPTGAGDSATAGAVLALSSRATPAEAALVANLVASITVQQLATTGTASPAELMPRLEMWLSQG
jgi:sugar/nucleoside kinase (ribokinase family)